MVNILVPTLTGQMKSLGFRSLAGGVEIDISNHSVSLTRLNGIVYCSLIETFHLYFNLTELNGVMK